MARTEAGQFLGVPQESVAMNGFRGETNCRRAYTGNFREIPARVPAANEPIETGMEQTRRASIRAELAATAAPSSG
jgi:hypothetical protein